MSLLARPWLTPLLYTLKKAGGCMERSRLNLGRMRRSRLRALTWSARPLVTVEEGRVCLTDRGWDEARRIELVGSQGNWTLYRYLGSTLILVNVKPTRITAYVIPHHLVEKALAENIGSREEAVNKLSLHPKTASILVKALNILRSHGINAYKPA